MASTFMLRWLPVTGPPPHFNHHVLRLSGLLTVTERDVERSGRVHVLHQDLHHVSFTEPGGLFQPLAPQGVQGHGRPAMQLSGNMRFTHTHSKAPC